MHACRLHTYVNAARRRGSQAADDDDDDDVVVLLAVPPEPRVYNFANVTRS